MDAPHPARTAPVSPEDRLTFLREVLSILQGARTLMAVHGHRADGVGWFPNDPTPETIQ